MILISCEYCGVVLDQSKFKPPEMFDDDGDYIEGNSEWDGDRYVPIIECPVCKSAVQLQMYS